MTSIKNYLAKEFNNVGNFLGDEEENIVVDNSYFHRSVSGGNNSGFFRLAWARSFLPSSFPFSVSFFLPDDFRGIKIPPRRFPGRGVGETFKAWAPSLVKRSLAAQLNFPAPLGPDKRRNLFPLCVYLRSRSLPNFRRAILRGHTSIRVAAKRAPLWSV